MKIEQGTLSVDEERPVTILGNGVSFISGDGPIEIIIPGVGRNYLEPGDSFTMQRGEFKNIAIKNKHTAGNTIKCVVGFVKNNTAKLTGEVTSNIGQAVNVNDSLVTLTGGIDALVAANSSRKHVTIQADKSNANSIFIGGSGVTAAKGNEVLPGETITLDFTSSIVQCALYVIGTATQKVRILEGV